MQKLKILVVFIGGVMVGLLCANLPLVQESLAGTSPCKGVIRYCSSKYVYATFDVGEPVTNIARQYAGIEGNTVIFYAYINQ